MKIIKFEKESCNPCNMVSNWLDDAGVQYERLNPFQSEEGAKLAAEYQIGFTVPVTVLVDANGNKVELTRGYHPDELKGLVEKLNA